MKNLKSFVLSVIGLLFMLSPALSGLMAQMRAHPVPALFIALAVLLASAIIPKKARSGFTQVAGVQQEIWVSYMIQRYYKDNQFLNYAFDEGDYVLNGAIVHIPQKGAKPVVVKNRAEFPAVAVQRGDSDITYVLDDYTTDPTNVTKAEQAAITYDKIDDVLGDHVGVLAETVADDMLYKWAFGIPGGSIMYTTGGPTAITADPTLEGSAGNVLSAFHKDIRKVNLALNLQNVPKPDRYGLLDENMADQIFDSLSDTQYRTFTEAADPSTGVLGKLYNFNIMTRSSVLAASNANVISAPGAIVQATDVAGSLFWQKTAIAKALGTVMVFDDTNNPLYYGDIVSTELRAGGRRRRGDNTGIIALLQGRPIA